MKKTISLLAMACGVLSGAAFAASEADIDASFRPYKSGVPSFPGLSAGTVVNKANVEQFKDALDEGLYTAVKNGWTELKVGPTTSFDLEPNYVEATRKNLNKTKLGAKTGEITGFVAGRPFPEEPSLSDPQAGDKIAWNYKYGINWGDTATITPYAAPMRSSIWWVFCMNAASAPFRRCMWMARAASRRPPRPQALNI